MSSASSRTKPQSYASSAPCSWKPMTSGNSSIAICRSRHSLNLPPVTTLTNSLLRHQRQRRYLHRARPDELTPADALNFHHSGGRHLRNSGDHGASGSSERILRDAGVDADAFGREARELGVSESEALAASIILCSEIGDCPRGMTPSEATVIRRRLGLLPVSRTPS